MAGLMNAVQKKGGLKRAADAEHDPADLGAGESAGGQDSKSAGAVAGNTDGVAASVSVAESAGQVAGGDAGQTDVGKASAKAGKPEGKPASERASNNGSKKAIKNASKKAPRRRGRPAGPDRTPLSVRILSQIDAGLTDAVEATGKSPQYIADEALASWLAERGYLKSAELPELRH